MIRLREVIIEFLKGPIAESFLKTLGSSEVEFKEDSEVERFKIWSWKMPEKFEYYVVVGDTVIECGGPYLNPRWLYITSDGIEPTSPTDRHYTAKAYDPSFFTILLLWIQQMAIIGNMGALSFEKDLMSMIKQRGQNDD